MMDRKPLVFIAGDNSGWWLAEILCKDNNECESHPLGDDIFGVAQYIGPDYFCKGQDRVNYQIENEEAIRFIKMSDVVFAWIGEGDDGRGTCASKHLAFAKAMGKPIHVCYQSRSAMEDWSQYLQFYAAPFQESLFSNPDVGLKMVFRDRGTLPTFNGYVYLLNAEGTNRYKIGITDDLERRVNQLNKGQAPFPVAITLAQQVADKRKVESTLHAVLSEYRTHGEWFEFDGPQLEAVCDFYKHMDLSEVGKIQEFWQYRLGLRNRVLE